MTDTATTTSTTPTSTRARPAVPSRTGRSHATVTRRIDAPVERVYALLADVHVWPAWGPFGRYPRPHLDRPGTLSHAVRLGRHDLRVLVTSPDAPYWLRYRVTGGPSRARHSAEVILSPTAEGGTELEWRATMTGSLPGLGRRRTEAVASAVSELTAYLAAAAEDAPTTRVEWAARAEVGDRRDRPVSARSRHELAA
jgi:uncharacterized protein YndB with AHSA1/START domain